MSSSKIKKPKKNATQPVNIYEEKILDPKYKTELCKTYEETGFCPYVNKCRFAHGKNELFDKSLNVNNYKIKKCKAFYCEAFCIYGSRCLFKHSDDMEYIEKSYFSLRIAYIEGCLLMYKNQLKMYMIDLMEIEKILNGCHLRNGLYSNYKRLDVFNQITNTDNKRNIKSFYIPKDYIYSYNNNIPSLNSQYTDNNIYNNDIIDNTNTFISHRKLKKNTFSTYSNYDSKCSTSENRSPI